MTPKEIRKHMDQLKRNSEAIKSRLAKQEAAQHKNDLRAAALILAGFLAFLGVTYYAFQDTAKGIINSIPATNTTDWNLPWWMVD